MEENGVMILLVGTSLYRYTLQEQPPAEWSIEMHSVEYQYEGIGAKNQAGLFFFFRDREEAISCGQLAKNSRGDDNIPLYLTQAVVTRKLRLLDLRETDSIIGALQTLSDMGIEVCNDSFAQHTSMEETVSWSVVGEAYRAFREGKNGNHFMPLFAAVSRKIQEVWKGELRYFCQSLTDFENGSVFKQRLEERGFDGYTFKEGNSDTICLISASGLREPETDRMDL